MGEFDRNKLFNILNELWLSVSTFKDSPNYSEKPISEKLDISIDKNLNKGERVYKANVLLKDGTEYTGDMINDLPDGHGIKTWPQPREPQGSKLSSQKIKYEGDFWKGSIHGFGKWTFANGSSYEGSWKNNEKNGPGKQVNKKGIIQTGNWVNGSLEGKGKEIWPNGDVYEGDFSMGK